MLPAVVLFVFCLASATSVAADAPSPPAAPAHLTSRGRWMVTGSLGGHYSTGDGLGLAASWRWGISASPGLTYFVRDHIGVGLFGEFGYREAEQLGDKLDETDGGVGVRLMIDVPLAQRVSVMLWPWFSHHWAVRDSTRHYVGLRVAPYDGPLIDEIRTAETLRYAQAALFVPLLFHAAANVGLGLGPYVTVDFALRHSIESAGGWSSAQGATAQQHPGYYRLEEPRYRITTGLMSTIVASF